MTANLNDDLVKIPQSEVAGSRSSARFSYQKNWALAELIEYHMAGKDYVFAFEFHDDILILDSDTHPSTIEFVQVKTKTTGQKWTVNQLIKSKKGKNGNPDKLSIVGKLYENKKNFNAYSSVLRFVTNAYFTFTTNSITVGNKIDSKEQSKIQTEIKKQLGGSTEIELGDLYFEQSDLSVNGHETHIQGILHKFFESIFGTGHSISVTPWYQAISDQIKSKNDYPPDHVKTFDDLIRNKCITKSEIERFIDRVRESHNNADNWSVVKSLLISEGFSPSDVIKLNKRWNQYTADRMDYDNEALKKLEREIVRELNIYVVSSDDSLDTMIEQIKHNISHQINKVSMLFDNHYVNSIILWQYCEQL